MHFYENKTDNFLRFGDVIKGYITADISIKEPLLKLPSEASSYRIDISTPSYCVVLTPCCSIEDGSIIITPLIHLRSDFMKNSYFVEDFTRINRPMLPEQTLSPDDWKKLEDGRKQQLVSEGKNFALLQFFVYPSSSAHFKSYPLRATQITHYMVDFKDIHEIKCNLIKNPTKFKETDDMAPIFDSKVLQLTPDARTELRNKLTYFFSRKPKEDLIVA